MYQQSEVCIAEHPGTMSFDGRYGWLIEPLLRNSLVNLLAERLAHGSAPILHMIESSGRCTRQGPEKICAEVITQHVQLEQSSLRLHPVATCIELIALHTPRGP